MKYFTCPDLIKFPYGENVLTYSKVTKKTTFLTKTEEQILSCCHTPRTLNGHAESCCGSLQLPLDTVKENLTTLIDRSCLIPQQLILERCREVETGSSPGIINHVGVITCNRPPQLRRCLTGYISNGQAHGRNISYVVADDTRDARVRSETRRMIRTMEKEFGVDIAYLGFEEKHVLKRRLASSGEIPEGVIEFALFGGDNSNVSIGANRNALLLHTAGRLVFSTDDDVYCQVARSPEAKNTVVVGNVENCHEYWFFPDRELALKSIEFTDIDFLAPHEKVLGLGVARYLSTLKDDCSLELRDVSPHFFRSLVSGRDRVRFTYAGTVGDSALRSPIKFLLMDGPSRSRFLANEGVYKSACKSREVIRAVTQLVLTKHTWCMTGAMAFDNRNIIPPFFPVERNEDSIYGDTLRATMRDACYGHIPYTFLHDPPDARVYADKEVFEAANYVHSSHLVIACLRSFNYSPTSIVLADDYSRLGEYLSAVGRMSLSDFGELIRIQLLKMQCSQVSALENIIRKHRGAPSYWFEDIERYLNTLQYRLSKPDCIYPQNLSQEGTLEEALLFTQSLIYNFGQLLCWWTAIFEKSKLLAEAA